MTPFLHSPVAPLTVLLCALTGCAPSVPTCGDLRSLSTAAREDRLAENDRACLNALVDHPQAPIDDRRAASTLLLHHARSIEDELSSWRRLAERHIQIAPDDTSVLLQLARFEQHQGPAGAQDSERWLARIDPHAEPLQGDGLRARASRVERLALLAIAAEMQAPPQAPVETRQRTAERARDWIAEARAQGVDHGRALAMCENAGPSRAWCLGEDEVMRRDNLQDE
jgi:hypothetical protein